MTVEGQLGPGGLARGYRVPSFALPVQDGRTLLFYELASGRPMLLAGTARRWSEEDALRFAQIVHGRAARRGIQSVVLVERSSDRAQQEPSAKSSGETEPGRSGSAGPLDGATAVDAEGSIRQRLFGPLIDGTEGALLVSDPNLRVIEGAAVEQAAVQSGSLEQGVDALIDHCLADLEAEQDVNPSVAPVLVVPRVLPIEVCRGLIDSFGKWTIGPSPMPTAEGDQLKVDLARKSRLDAMIEDPRLERELTTSIAHRVLPEIAKAFQYEATRLERLKLVCYRASDGGHFGAHRDNTAPETAHRRFALTLNLNTGDYEGGALEFPEYGPRCAYDVPAGSALLFSGTHAHRVAPVARGERFALISFCFGEEALKTRRSSNAGSWTGEPATSAQPK